MLVRRKEMIIFCLLRWFVDVMVWRWRWRWWYKYFIREKPASQHRIFCPLIFVILVYPGDELRCFEGKLPEHNADEWDDNLFSKERENNSIRKPANVSDAFPFNISINYTFRMPYSYTVYIKDVKRPQILTRTSIYIYNKSRAELNISCWFIFKIAIK